MERILEGSVARFEVPDLLTFLNMGRRTGVLVMERPDQETKVFFRDGQPIFSTSTKDDLRVASVLARHGHVNESDLPRVGARLGHAIGVERVNEMLVDEGILKPDQIGPFLKLQISEVIFDTFEWKAGIFAFYDQIPPPETAVTIEIDLQNVIMEGVRRIDERGRLDELFPDHDMIVEAVANPERVKNSVTLTGEEWRVFFLVDGRRSIKEICHLAGDPDQLATLQVLHNLVVANLTSIAPATVDAAEPEPASIVEPAMSPSLSSSMQITPEIKPPPVEFRSSQPPRKAVGDTRQIVNPEAREYLSDAKQLAVARLVLRDKDRPEASFPLTRDSSTLGRHRNNDIVISDARVSSFHARIDRATEGHQLVDLGSRNGTYVNGRKQLRVMLENGDELRVGAARLKYLVDFNTEV
jgi:hypothetical protein